MSIQVQCEHCGAKRKVNERLAGRTIRCPGCDQTLTIPRAVPLAGVTAVAKAVPNEAVPNEAGQDEAMEVEAIYLPDASPSSSSVNGSSVNGLSVAMAPQIEKLEPSRKDDEDDDLVPPRKKREDGELDMTPMVDVTFLLLIFFMVTASFSLQKSIQVPRQSSDLPSMSNVEEETEELDPVELEIDESGAFLVLAAEWERETPGKQNLITALKESIGDNRDGMKLDIKVHENAKLQMLVDGMDAGTIAGFTQIQVTEVDGFD